jgi:hypothetical protein
VLQNSIICFMSRLFWGAFLVIFLMSVLSTSIFAQSDSVLTATPKASAIPLGQASPQPSPTEEPTPTPSPRTDLTQESPGAVEPLKQILEEQELGGVWPFNPIKYAIRTAVNAGVPINTITLLLLLPGVAAIIATARHLVGLRGFGIFLPASLSVVFVATGPVLGIILFMIIVFVSTVFRVGLKKMKIKLQYLPRMALLLWVVVLSLLGVLLSAPLIRQPDLNNVSIFPVLILVLLAEDFTRVQLGKSVKTAINITTETLILALVSYFFLVLKPVQEFALLKPEILIASIAVFDYLIGKYVGLRFIEFWRFRRLILGS